MKDINVVGKNLVVLGGGESGVGAAVLGKARGMEVFLSDAGTLKPQYEEQLLRRGISFETGGHSAEKVLAADICVKSPGIPDTAPLVAALRDKGVPVISEIEFAGWFTDAKMICITGSNGKTTTTMLTHHILTQAGIDAGLAGNVGHSLALQVAEEPHPVYVIELSSFQLDGMNDFKADVAVLLNITPDHLDRYDHKMENYAASKLRITRNQDAECSFIYWPQDPWTAKTLALTEVNASLLPFSDTVEADTEGNRYAATLKGDTVVFDTPRFPAGKWEMKRSELSLPGLHNLYNSMAAGLAAAACGLPADKIKKGLETFKAVEHRLEPLGVIRGLSWINDSKATNVNSTFYALGSMNTPTILILGGTDKGNDYSEILPLVKEKVKTIVAMGIDNAKIINFFKDHVKVIDTHSLEECLTACVAAGEAGDTVLLSPACASFDLFKSYIDRGLKFKQAVKGLEP